MEQADVFRLRAVVALGLHEHLPLPAEAVEVVHEVAAHERLQRLADLREIDALREDLVAIDVDQDLRHRRQERAGGGRNLRPLAHRFEEAVQVFTEKSHVAARAVFEHERDAAGGADAGNGRRRKGEGDCLPESAASLALMVCLIAAYCSSGAVRSSQGLSVMKKNALNVVLTVLQQIVADHAS